MQSIQESARSQGNQGGNVPPSNSQYVPNPVGASSMTYLFPLKKFQGGEGLARSGLPDQLPAREFELGLNDAGRGVLIQRSQRGHVPVPFHDSYCGINGTYGSLISDRTSLAPSQELPLRSDRRHVPDDAKAVWLGPESQHGGDFGRN